MQSPLTDAPVHLRMRQGSQQQRGQQDPRRVSTPVMPPSGVVDNSQQRKSSFISGYPHNGSGMEQAIAMEGPKMVSIHRNVNGLPWQSPVAGICVVEPRNQKVQEKI